MKISQFAISAAGFLYSAATGNLPELIIFGVLAIMEHRKIMSALEGGEEPWHTS